MTYYIDIRLPPILTLFPYTTLFRSGAEGAIRVAPFQGGGKMIHNAKPFGPPDGGKPAGADQTAAAARAARARRERQAIAYLDRSEEHTSELQSRQYLVCRLLLETKK